MRSSFPEAEVTRSLSSNLLKKGFTKLSEDDARVIDTNELVAKRIRELSAKMQKESNTGFVSGLAADKVEAPVTDPEEEKTEFTPSGNVIKAGEDIQKLKEDAEAEAQKIVEDARAQAESILQDARSQAEAERADIQEAARRQGQQEAQAEAETVVESVRALVIEYQPLKEKNDAVFKG